MCTGRVTAEKMADTIAAYSSLYNWRYLRDSGAVLPLPLQPCISETSHMIMDTSCTFVPHSRADIWKQWLYHTQMFRLALPLLWWDMTARDHPGKPYDYRYSVRLAVPSQDVEDWLCHDDPAGDEYHDPVQAASTLWLKMWCGNIWQQTRESGSNLWWCGLVTQFVMLTWLFCSPSKHCIYVVITITEVKFSNLTAKRYYVWLVAWHTGRTLVFDQRTFPVLHSAYSWRMTTCEGKPSDIAQPTKLFVLSGSINE